MHLGLFNILDWIIWCIVCRVTLAVPPSPSPGIILNSTDFETGETSFEFIIGQRLEVLNQSCPSYKLWMVQAWPLGPPSMNPLRFERLRIVLYEESTGNIMDTRNTEQFPNIWAPPHRTRTGGMTPCSWSWDEPRITFSEAFDIIRRKYGAMPITAATLTQYNNPPDWVARIKQQYYGLYQEKPGGYLLVGAADRRIYIPPEQRSTSSDLVFDLPISNGSDSGIDIVNSS